MKVKLREEWEGLKKSMAKAKKIKSLMTRKENVFKFIFGTITTILLVILMDL